MGIWSKENFLKQFVEIDFGSWTSRFWQFFDSPVPYRWFLKKNLKIFHQKNVFLLTCIDLKKILDLVGDFDEASKEEAKEAEIVTEEQENAPVA